MERRIDFSRDRRMLCGACGHDWRVELDWIDRWDQGVETCPGCGMTCAHEDSPRVTADPADLALDDDRVARFFWYHTSTHPDWPRRNFDPAADLSAETRRMMGGDERVAVWAARQRAKALHVGTYEAAVHNMLRRIRDQADHDNQFYLYRVHLIPSVTVREGWLIDPSDFVGDVALADVCPPGIDVARYLNYHEDPGGLSLALGRNAITRVQGLAVPLPDAWDESWVHDAVAALANASDTELSTVLADRLPTNLRVQFAPAAAFAEGDDSEQWARCTSSLISLISDPGRVLAALDQQDFREVRV
ncbi:hypothetical protein [Streptomyces anthocyanicus]|uniref:hypothetical protein n=1 Tax=Streptomyces anthocyanicus TaxID=68174 RepID=UPI00364E4306